MSIIAMMQIRNSMRYILIASAGSSQGSCRRVKCSRVITAAGMMCYDLTEAKLDARGNLSMELKTAVRGLTVIVCCFLIIGCGGGSGSAPGPAIQTYSLGANAQGAMELVDNIYNVSIVSKNDNVLKAEYDAGFIQGKLQKRLMISARDNDWDLAYYMDPAHSFPKQMPPSPAEMARALKALRENYDYTIGYIGAQGDPVVARNLRRILFRMLGLYHGTRLGAPADLDFSGDWLPDSTTFQASELTLGYETPELTFMDVYFLNAFADVMDAIPAVASDRANRLTKCSAFVKKVPGDIIITHNSWSGYLSQSMAMNLYVNDTFVTFNALSPGLVSSLTDFGYNNQGIMFNETTHHATTGTPNIRSLWMLWRAALAEQFAGSLDEFFRYVSLAASGTYMNGYMIVDTRTREIGLVEMSDRNFVFFKPREGGYDVITKPEGLFTGYDGDLLTPDYILGINYPVSYQIRQDLAAVDNRPARRYQFLMGISGVKDIESAKSLITYTDPANPLSIYGRWDLGYGLTAYPKTVPDGSIDAKAVSASMTAYAMGLQGVFDPDSPNRSFWMRFGTPHVNGQPFVWSASQWAGQKLRDVPDRVDGSYNLLRVHMR